MKMRVLAAGLTGFLILGGTMTIVQRAITQRTRGVLPEANDPAHADSRRATPILALPVPTTPPTPTPSAVDVAIATAPPEPALVQLPVEQMPGLPAISPTVAVVEPALGAPPDQAPGLPPASELSSAPPAVDPGPTPADPAVSAAHAAPIPNPTAANPGPRDVLSDPVQSVESFVEQNRREADQAIRTLASEAENLKGRLAKVEVALARWQTFSHALNTDLPPGGGSSAASGPAESKPRWSRPMAEVPAGRDDPIEGGRASAPGSQPTPAEELAPDPTPIKAPRPKDATPAAEPTPTPPADPGPAPEVSRSTGEPTAPPPVNPPAPGDAPRTGAPEPAPPLEPAPEPAALPKTAVPR